MNENDFRRFNITTCNSLFFHSEDHENDDGSVVMLDCWRGWRATKSLFFCDFRCVFWEDATDSHGKTRWKGRMAMFFLLNSRVNFQGFLQVDDMMLRISHRVQPFHIRLWCLSPK